MNEARIILIPHILFEICENLPFEDLVALWQAYYQVLPNFQLKHRIATDDIDGRIPFLTGINELTVQVYPRIRQFGSKNAFLETIQTGNITLFYYYLKKGYDPKVERHNLSDVFELAIRSNQLPIFKILLEIGVNVDNPAHSKETLLYIAALYNKIEILQYLLSLGTDINTSDYLGYTALIGAVSSREKELVKFLLEQGANASFVSENGHSAFPMCLYARNFEIISMLIQAGADPDRLYISDRNTIMEIMAIQSCYGTKENNLNILNFLIDSGANINHETLDHQTPLTLASEVNDPDYIQLLMKRGADPKIGIWSNIARQNFSKICEIYA